MRPLTPRKIVGICAGLLGILFIESVISLGLGALSDWRARYCGDALPGRDGALGRDSVGVQLVVFGLRLPRIALGILVGAALSTAGAGFRRCCGPLADPYVLGVSSGAALGAILSLVVAPHTLGAIQLAAFSERRRRLRRFIFLGGAADSWTARRCCWRGSWWRRFFRRSSFF